MNIDYEDKRTLVWAIYALANYDIPKEEFEERALNCVNETIAMSGDIIPDVSKCAYCGSKNVVKENEGIWCYDCKNDRLKKHDC